MSLPEGGKGNFVLEVAPVIKCFLVFRLDGGDARFVVLTPGFQVLVYLAKFRFSGFFASELDF